MNSFYPQTELQTELLGCMNDNFDSFPELTYNLFDPNDFSYLDESSYNNPLLPIEPEVLVPFSLQQEVLDPTFNYPKRQKQDYDCYQEINYSDQYNNPVLFNGNNCYSLTMENMPMLLPDFDLPALPPVYNGGRCEEKVKKQSLSAQSIAARQRRRNITEKTQELGKLIPGGGKLNTAEMLQSAYKYIKYLQAQVGILEFMGNGDGFECEELNGLLESTLVQEKLYSTEKCLVPEKFVKELSSDDKKFEFKAQVLKEIRQLIPVVED
ncbi:hypothetical protein RD792_003816 [Penstemon davidsonii]|uniref:BHLH domain-containing protein n=1 Tax=Penstemon davidsonii TaxID=160366 RepID=A0ABR0DFQ8_9LAMI|nr:hypothetical protein RD792_003816 [Penstemon davidsonii]